MRLRIIVIDDEECIRDTFRWHLEEQGHEVITAKEPRLCDVYCGQNCQERYPCGHLLLTDYHLPEMTGLEFIEQRLKRGCKGAAFNQIIMSGNTSAIDLGKARELGCQVVQKPLTFNELDQLVSIAKGRIDPEGRLADLNLKPEKPGT